jgi:hypothetical protein
MWSTTIWPTNRGASVSLIRRGFLRFGVLYRGSGGQRSLGAGIRCTPRATYAAIRFTPFAVGTTAGEARDRDGVVWARRLGGRSYVEGPGTSYLSLS